jgi:hypothetical protein
LKYPAAKTRIVVMAPWTTVGTSTPASPAPQIKHVVSAAANAAAWTLGEMVDMQTPYIIFVMTAVTIPVKEAMPAI